jgi:tetratricopeptide (TPR) repeat protein
MPPAKKLVGVAIIGVLATLLVFAKRPLAAMAYANAGALSQVRAELANGLSDAQRNALLERSAGYYEQAIATDRTNRTAHQRLGMLAMDARQLDEAIAHLEAAQQAARSNTTTHKALGLAYTWAGQLHQAERLLADVPDIIEELNVWGWWWGTQEEEEWAANAYQVSLLLNPDQPSVREALAAVLAE